MERMEVKQKNKRLFIISCILLFCLAIRLIWVFLIAGHIPYALGGAAGRSPDPSIKLSCDFTNYYNPIALNILKGEGFRDMQGKLTALIPPLHPFFLSVVYKIFGQSIWIIRLISIVIDCFSCFLIIMIAHKMFDRKVGLVSGLLYAVFPIMFYTVGGLGTEPLFIFLFISSIFFLVKTFNEHVTYGANVVSEHKSQVRIIPEGDNSKGCIDAVLGGLLMGFTTLCRPIPLALPPFILIGLLYAYKSKIKLALAKFILIVLAMGAAITPWIVRNYIVFERFIPVADTYKLADRDEKFGYFDAVAAKDGLEAGVREHIGKRVKLMFSNPALFVKKTTSSFFKMWFTTNTGNWQTQLMLLQFSTLFLAILGMLLSWKSGYRNPCLLSIIIYWVLSQSVMGYTLARYTAPIIPLLLIYVSFTLVWVFKKMHGKYFLIRSF